MIRLEKFLRVKMNWMKVMNARYNFVNAKIRTTLRHQQKTFMQLGQVKRSTPSTLGHEIQNLESLFTQSLGMVKAAMEAGEEVVNQESRQSEQLAANLKKEIAMLQANLKEAEEAFAKKDLARQKIEESLNAKIRSVQEETATKEALLVIRENEIADCKSKLEANGTKISDLELKIRKTEEEAASNANCPDDLPTQTLTRVTGLEAQLMITEELASYQESNIQELKKELDAKTQEFDCIMKDKQELLMRQDSEINDLKFQLKRLTTGIVVGEMATPEILQRIITEFREATNMIDTLASLIVKQQARALGECVETFPRARLSELVECLAKDIEDQDRQSEFRERCSQNTLITLS